MAVCGGLTSTNFMDASLFGGFLETLQRPRMIAFSSFAAGSAAE
jgi:hypothetical protein